MEALTNFIKNRATILSLGVAFGGLFGYNITEVTVPPIKVEVINFPADEELKPPVVELGEEITPEEAEKQWTS